VGADRGTPSAAAAALRLLTPLPPAAWLWRPLFRAMAAVRGDFGEGDDFQAEDGPDCAVRKKGRRLPPENPGTTSIQTGFGMA
jgi:hypothetical protein